ncbi:MAG: hypothetical protein E8D40_15245 [Nitrospira sp.]|nr:MAG: hypothetical protein E8D40_15245 [Nitrospira sp.]
MNGQTSERAVVLASGGLDSTVTAAIARRDGYALYLLTIAYQQRHAVEIERSRQVATALEADQHLVINVDLGTIGGSALTGHLVLTTVHANNVFDVIGRFASMGIDAYNFLAALNCVLAQRLVRILCSSCRTLVKAQQALIEESGLDYEQYKETPFHEAKGCPQCHGTGYRGRKCITEFLDLTDEIKEMIHAERPLSEIRYRAVTDGMITLRRTGMCL